MVIVAAVDGSKRAAAVVNEAVNLANAFDDTVHVVHVLTKSKYIDMGRTAAQNMDDSFSVNQVREEAANIATEAVTEIDSPVEFVGKMGDPADEIVNYADEQSARYIVVAGRKRSPVGKAIFGSVAQAVLLNADVPVVSARSS